MSPIHALILGIVEGITEFLPISSTGHLVLTSAVLQIPASEFLSTFEIAIQIGAIGAGVVLYLKQVVKHPQILWSLALSFIPAALLGWLTHRFISQFLQNPSIILWALGIGGIALIVFDLYAEKKDTPNTTPEQHTELFIPTKFQALVIGLGQCCALIPGVSRSAATIITARLLGISRSDSVSYSFMLGIPTLGAASLFALIRHPSPIEHHQWFLLILGTLSAGVVAYLTMRFLSRYVTKKRLTVFGIYRIVIALVMWHVLKNQIPFF